MGRKKRGMHKKVKTWAAAAIAAALLAFGGYTVYLYQGRLAAQAQAEEWRQQREAAGPDGAAQEGEEFGQEKEEIVYNGDTYVRNTYMKAYLFLGVDRPGTFTEPTVPGQGGQSDGIFLAAWDTSRNTVQVVMIPRDTMTEIILTDLSGNELGADVQHITLGYAYGDGLERSCEYMSRAVTNLCGGLGIDGYMSIGLGALPVLNDLVGGVEVTVEDGSLAEADDRFSLGETIRLEGDEAERFLRYRDIGVTQTAIGRMDRHKAYLEGFARAAKETARKEDGLAVKILDGIAPYMVTDMAKDEYLKLAADFLSSSQTLTEADFLTLPGEGAETGLYDEYHVDKDEVLQMILGLFYRQKE